MLHELLLALSGHPSPLFDETRLPSGRLRLNEDLPLLTPSETALLQSIGRLAERHRQLRKQTAIIATTHQSIICRAVATSIQQTHLGRFQQKILEVESKILARDASIVGAYNIVPLASIVGEFDDWHRRMLWYYDISQFMQPFHKPSNKDTELRCTGSAIIDKLRNEANTGFVEIEKVAIELSRVAETAWLRQVVSWLLHGNLPRNGAQDFFVQQNDTADEDTIQFRKEPILLPSFVTGSTASSILFVGKSLSQIHSRTSQNTHQPQNINARELRAKLASENLVHLSSLMLPIVPAQLSQAISKIRLSLSRDILQHLLPMKATMQVLACLRYFFLLSRGEFATALLDEAQKRMEMRESNMGRLLQQDPVRATRNLSIKDAELQQTLTATWKALIRDHDDLVDDVIDFARTHITLSTRSKQDSRPSSSDSAYGDMPTLAPVPFDDVLFPSSCSLGLTVLSPIDLFISTRDVQTYSTVFSYLLSIRRAKLHLSDLWRRSSVRRDRKTSNGLHDNDRPDHLSSDRRRNLRRVWATCSAALFLISETSNYFDVEVVKPYFDHFENWVRSSTPTANSMVSDDGDSSAQKDPETLAAGHRAMLACLVYALLLTDISYTRQLRSLLGNLDTFIAFFTRLLTLHDRADGEREAHGEITRHTKDEERRVTLELELARTRVDSDLKSVLARVRDLDTERVGAARHWDLGQQTMAEYIPWRGAAGLERLLMKLEFGRMLETGVESENNRII